MGKKNGKQPMAPSHNERPQGTSLLSQTASANPGNCLTQFSKSGRLFAQLSLAVDADTVRVYEVQSGQCVGRWASSSAAERASVLEWVELPSSSSSSSLGGSGGGEKLRHKRRRKASQGGLVEDEEEQDPSNPAASTSKGEVPSSSHIVSPPAEAIAIGLKSGSTIILHPTQSTVLQTLSHPSITSSVSAICYPSSSTSSSSSSSTTTTPSSSSSSAATSRHILWTSTSSGLVSAWSLPSLSGHKGRLLAQYDTQNTGCASLAVQYESEANKSSKSSKTNGATSNGSSRHEKGSSKVYLLLGQYSIKLFESILPSTTRTLDNSTIERPKTTLLCQCSGHATSVLQLTWLSRPTGLDSNQEDPQSLATPHLYFLSIAKGDRYLSLWAAAIPVDTTGFGAPPCSGLLLGTLGLDDEPRRLVVATDQSYVAAVSSDAVRIVSISDSSFVHRDVATSPVKHRKRQQSEVKILNVDSTIATTSASGSCLDVLLSNSSEGTAIVVVGSVKPQMEHVRYKDESKNFLSLIELKSDTKSALAVMNGHTDGQQTSRAKYSEPAQSAILSAEATGLLDADVDAEDVHDATVEPTIAERLRALEVEERRATALVGKVAGTRGHTRSRSGKKSSGTGTQALSTTQSLVQALHSADIKLLESCLAESDPRVIRATVLRVPNTLVLPLVEALVERLSRTRRGVGEGSGGVDASRGQVLAEWLRNVLTVHLSYLITIPSLIDRLASLHATLEARGSFHTQLLALSGRLDLVVSQIDIRTQVAPVERGIKKTLISDKNTPAPKTNAVNKYVEGEDESESEEEEQDDGVVDGVRVEPAEEDGDEEIEDLVMANGDLDINGVASDDSDISDDEDEEADIPAMRKTKGKAGKPQVNGFLDLEAEESENEGSDEDGPIPKRSSVKLNGIINEDSLDEDDEEDLDQYESDFINDESEEEEEEEESGDEDDADED